MHNKVTRKAREEALEVIGGFSKGVNRILEILDDTLMEFDAGQMKEIRIGLEVGVDVSVYAKPEFDAGQMHAIMHGLTDGIDVSIFAKPEFSAGQMEELCWGLRHGVDISNFAKPEVSATEMSRRLEKMAINQPVQS